jgi:hypothetical protein
MNGRTHLPIDEGSTIAENVFKSSETDSAANLSVSRKAVIYDKK